MIEAPSRRTRFVAFRGRLLELVVDRVQEPLLNGDLGPEVRREVVRHPGAVVIVAVDESDRVVMVRQYRYAVDQALLELPAGTREPGETPEETAARELREETGYRARKLTQLGTIFSAPGFCDEQLSVFLATGLVPGPTDADEGEDIEVVHLPLAEAESMLVRGAFLDAKTVAGIGQHLLRRRCADS